MFLLAPKIAIDLLLEDITLYSTDSNMSLDYNFMVISTEKTLGQSDLSKEIHQSEQNIGQDLSLPLLVEILPLDI